MNEFVREIFNAAVIKEQAAQRLYLELASKAKDQGTKELFERLASEEKLHEDLFSKMDPSIVQEVNSADLNSIKVNLVGEVSDSENVSDALELAINEEQKALDEYMILVKHLPLGEARDAVKEIAGQEARHKLILQKVKMEFDKGEWNETR